MKNIKEIKPILTAVYALNRIGHKDKRIEKIIDYAFKQILGMNTNLIVYTLMDAKENEIMAAVKLILKRDTKFNVEDL